MDEMTTGQKRGIVAGIGVVFFLVLAIFIWIFFVPPFNVPKFQSIENNQTGFLVPLDQDTAQQVHFESASYLKEKKVAEKRVQIHRRWVQNGWLYTTGEYLDVERLITVDRSSIIREWTDATESGTSTKDESLSAQTKDGTGLKLNFTCTAFIPEADETTPQGAEHFLYYYRGDTLAHVVDHEVRGRVQAVAAEFAAQYTLEALRGTQHKLVEAVRQDVIPFFQKRGISITNMGMVGGFHYINKAIQTSIDEAIKAQQMKVVALAQQDKEKVEQQTKLQNQEIDNKTMRLEAEGKAAAAIARAEGEAKAKLAAATVEAESAKVRATGEAAAIKLEADAESYRYAQLDKFRELVVALKNIDVEKAWRSQWTGGVPQTVIQGQGNGVLPIFPMEIEKRRQEKK
jgi:hypothetical protein